MERLNQNKTPVPTSLPPLHYPQSSPGLRSLYCEWYETIEVFNNRISVLSNRTKQELDTDLPAPRQRPERNMSWTNVQTIHSILERIFLVMRGKGYLIGKP